MTRNSIFAARRSVGDAVMVGDSLTEMADWDADHRIINRGIYSDKTAGLLARTDELARLNAPIALVIIGTNDFAISLNVDWAFERYTKIINVLAPKRVIVQSTLFRNARHPKENQAIAELNRKLQVLCGGQSCDNIDLNTIFAPNGVLLPIYSIVVHILLAMHILDGLNGLDLPACKTTETRK